MSAAVRLQQIVDECKEYTHRGRLIKIISWSKQREIYRIKALVNHKEEIIEKDGSEQVEFFLDGLRPVKISDQPQPVVKEAEPEPMEVKPMRRTKEQPPIPPSPGVVMYNESKEVFKTLSDQLLNDINKVREDPKYIPQAKQISNSVNSLINLTKLQVQMLNVKR